MAMPNLNSDGQTITVRVPILMRRRGGRKLVLAPDGSDADYGVNSATKLVREL
jgi:hypothetical protein